MKKQTPTRSNVVALKQILNLIPLHLIGRHAREVGVDAKARTFSVASHLASMLFAQLSHAIGLNDVCDWLRLKAPVLARFGVTNFLGHSANAVRWQVYTALLVYVLLRFLAHLSAWGHSFTRLFAVSRSVLWERIDLLGHLKSYGTASGRFTVQGNLAQAWLPGLRVPLL